jgi:hypothetical protein
MFRSIKQALAGVGAVIGSVVLARAVGAVAAAATESAAEALLPTCLTTIGAAQELGKVAGKMTEQVVTGPINLGVNMLLNCCFGQTTESSLTACTNVTITAKPGAPSATAQVLGQALVNTKNCTITSQDQPTNSQDSMVAVASYPGAIYQLSALPTSDAAAYEISTSNKDTVQTIAKKINDDPIAQTALADAALQGQQADTVNMIINMEKNALLRSQNITAQAQADLAYCNAELQSNGTLLAQAQADFAYCSTELRSNSTDLIAKTASLEQCTTSLKQTNTSLSFFQQQATNCTTALTKVDAELKNTQAINANLTAQMNNCEATAGSLGLNATIFAFALGATGLAAAAISVFTCVLWKEKKAMQKTLETMDRITITIHPKSLSDTPCVVNADVEGGAPSATDKTPLLAR